MDYYLIVTTAGDCIACQLAWEGNLFKELITLEGTIVKEILYVSAPSVQSNLVNLPPVFSLHRSFPNYKIMSVDTYNSLMQGKDLIDKVYFFNACYHDGLLEKTREYPHTFEGIKEFCEDSIEKDIERNGKTAKRTVRKTLHGSRLTHTPK